MENFDFDRIKSVHFIGIGGISMSGLAEFCLKENKAVTGSDRVNSSVIKNLKDDGAVIFVPHNRECVYNQDVVVYSSAVPYDNEELVRAKELNIPLLKRSEFLGAILRSFKKTVAVSGSHGKTTTTAMISEILEEAKLFPTAFIGGEDYKLSNLKFGEKNIAVVEACEYKKNFLDIGSDIAVVLNIDNDHLDSYKNMDDMKATFYKFANRKIAVYNADDINSTGVGGESSVSFGIKNNAVYTAKNLRKNGEGYSFTAYKNNMRKGRINLSVIGRFNVYNALASFAVADLLGVDFKVIKYALENFRAVKRRSELIGKCLKKDAFADYAHHPKEIKAEISAVNKMNTLFVFQPHTYSRTKILMDDFIGALKNLDKVIIYKTYSAREDFDEKGSAYTLYKNLKSKAKGKISYAETESELFRRIKQNSPFDKVVFLGAGDIYEIAKRIIREKG